MRTIIGLLPRRAGTIKVLGVDMSAADEAERQAVERRWGVLFQQGALFSSLTVKENLQFPMREYLKVSQRLMDELAVGQAGDGRARRQRRATNSRPSSPAA